MYMVGIIVVWYGSLVDLRFDNYRRRGGGSQRNIHRRGEGSGARKSHLEDTSPDLT